MEFRIENSSSQVKDFQIEGSWIPATMAKPSLVELHPICRDTGENQSWQANSRELKSVLQENSQVQASCLGQNSSACCFATNSVNISGGLDSRGENLSGKSQCNSNNITMYKNFSVDNFNKWDMPFQDLLALVDAGAVSKSENGRSSSFLSIPNALREGKQVTKSPINLQPGMHQIAPGSEFQISGNSTPDTQQCGQHSPSRYFFDLNSTPGTQSEADISISLPSQFAPVTPDQTRKTESRQISDLRNSSRDERINQANHKQRIGSAKRTSLEEQPQLLQEQSCDAVSTQPQVDPSPDKGANESANLNRTPTQKPRRRKHRPKVVIEGQPKRTRKPRTPKSDTPTETPTSKRKYVRRKRVEKPTDTPEAEASETTDSKTVRQTRKSCRRSLSFDAASHVIEERSSCTHEQALVTRVQSTVQLQYGLERTFEKTKVGIAYELTQTTNQVLEKYLSLPERQAPILSTPKNIDQPHTKSVNNAQNAYRRRICRIHFSDETQDKEASTVESPNDSICSTSACMNKEKPARGTKRGHSEKIGGIEMCAFNSMGAQYNSCQAYLSMCPDYGSGSFPEMRFPVIYKKKRTEKGQQLSTSNPLSSEAAAEGFVGDMASDPFSLDSARRFSDAQLTASNGPGITAVGTTQEEQHYFNCVLAFDHTKQFKKKRTKGLTRVRDVASFAGNFGSNQWPTPANEVASGVMQEFDASHQPPTRVEALAANVKLGTRKRTKKNSTSTLMSSTQYYHQQSPSDYLGVYPRLIWKSMNPVDALVEQFEHLHINRQCSEIANHEHHVLIPYYTRYQEKNALVLYQRGGTLVPFEGSFNPIKRRKPRPKVDLDDETTRVWKLLLEDINSQGIDGTDEEKAKWWEEERKVFRGRADSFIARMHLVQGDRRFSRWKGSVLDSVIGVFLTQNVSDHLSSSAFMSLAARYPLKSERNHGPTNGEKTSVSVGEPEITEPDLDEAISWHEGKLSEPANDQSSMTLQDVGYSEEKEVVNSNEFSRSSSIDSRPKDKSDCEVIEICGSNLTVCHESALCRSGNHIAETVTKFVGDHREMDAMVSDVVSSQTSVVSSQNSMDSSFAKSEERIASCSQSNSRKEQIAGCEPSVPDGSLIELLQIQRMTILHGVYSEERADGSSNKIGQENLADKAYSEEQNQAISTSCQAVPSSNILHFSNSGAPIVECFEFLGKENRMSDVHKSYEEKCASEQSGLSSESASQATVQTIRTTSSQGETRSCNNLHAVVPEVYNSQLIAQSPESNMDQKTQKDTCEMQQVFDAPNFSEEISDVTESTTFMDNSRKTVHKAAESNLNDHGNLQTQVDGVNEGSSKVKRVRAGKAKQNAVEWDSLRQQTKVNGKVRGKEYNTMDSLDYEAVRCADVDEIADTIKERGMNNMLAERIKDFLNRLVREHGSIDLEWLRDVPPDKAKEYLLSVRGLGLKSVECVRLLTLHHLAFPVDTNVGRIAVRLGWVPLQPLPESLQLHLLEMYPVLESIQKYLWPRLCKLDQRTLYELHYQMITFGKVFCTKNKPNCNACPMRGECRHFASAFASARLALPAPAEKSIVSATENKATHESPIGIINGQQLSLPPPSCQMDEQPAAINNEPVIEEPATPGPIIEVPTTPEQEQIQYQEMDIEDGFGEDPDEIPTIKLNIKEFTQNLQNYMEKNMDLEDGDMSRALVALTPEVASIPTPKLKNVSRLRTEHQVYELPDSHPLLEGLDKREPDDPSSYLLAIWTPGETAESIQPPEGQCSTQELGRLCDEQTCFSCNSLREANSQTVRGTLLIPCRTAMRGSFPLNGTYFQVNEVFADHDSSLCPIDVPRSWIWNLPRRTVFFGTSIPTIFKGLTTEGIQYCFWRGFVCVRGFDQTTRAPRPLMARLHFPASKLTGTRGRADES